MVMPKYVDTMLPILEHLASKEPCHTKHLVEVVAEKLNMTADEVAQTLPTGPSRLHNRIQWACFEMKMAGLVDVKNAIVSITPDGKRILGQGHNRIDQKFLRTLPRYEQYWVRIHKKDTDSDNRGQTGGKPEQTPEDMINEGYKVINDTVKNELLERIGKNSPRFFEETVLRLIQSMGYGIDHKVLGRSHDGGIDGMIKEDKLGFEKIYFQAKRWQANVPIDQIRGFAGALMSRKSKKGIFITSSDFTNEAHKFVKEIDTTIILINGEKLAEYMYDYDIGVNISSTYQIKKIDEEFFNE